MRCARIKWATVRLILSASHGVRRCSTYLDNYFNRWELYFTVRRQTGKHSVGGFCVSVTKAQGDVVIAGDVMNHFLQEWVRRVSYVILFSSSILCTSCSNSLFSLFHLLIMCTASSGYYMISQSASNTSTSTFSLRANSNLPVFDFFLFSLHLFFCGKE